MTLEGSCKFTCSICGKHYQQSSHVRRHERTHVENIAERSQCKYCEQSFARRDVWRRHLTRCSRNVDHNETPPAKRGQKPRACDHCFLRKMACDTKHPCSRCSSSKLRCTYDRLDSFPPVSDPAPSTIIGPGSQPRNAETKMAVPFLLNMTDPSAGSMVESLVGDNDLRTDGVHPEPPSIPSPALPAEPDPPSLFTDNLSLFLDDRFYPWALPAPQDDPSPEWTALLHSSPIPTPSTPPDEEPTLTTIINHLHTLHTTLLRTEPTTYDGTFSLPLARRVFTSANRALLVGRYFRFTHREFPLTHRPSFDLATVSPGLLLAYFLCGSMFTNTPGASPYAFLRVAEEYLFRAVGEMLAPRGEEVVETRELYEALQAALLVHCTQFALQGAGTRERNRTVRLPVLVAAVRRLGLLGVRHGGEGGWKGFVGEETKLRIGAWTLLADWQQSGLYRLPPLMTISELTGDFPCLPSLWEAETAEQFNAIVEAKGPSVWKRSGSIRQAVETLMADATWPSLDKFPLFHPTVHDLHFLVFAIHVVIGSASLMGLLPVSGGAILRATTRWEQLWKQVVSTSAATEKGAPYEGTVSGRLCPELCWLARKLVEGGMDGRLEGLEYYQGVGHYSLDPLHALINRIKDS